MGLALHPPGRLSAAGQGRHQANNLFEPIGNNLSRSALEGRGFNHENAS
jgi:hypothetical protein